MLQQLTRNINLLELNLYDIKRVIENSTVDTQNSCLVDIFEDFGLPVNDMESFNNLETFLAQEENMKKSVGILDIRNNGSTMFFYFLDT